MTIWGRKKEKKG